MNVLFSYSSFKAVICYRIANHILNIKTNDKYLSVMLYRYALNISSKGKLLSGAEIHPATTIGKRFVLDHGIGTVIGETCVIGDDAYILGSVILGARGIASNPQGQRHPILGNNIEVGAFSCIFGPVTIGNHVFIGAHCIIEKSIPDNIRVTLKNSFYSTRSTL